MFAQQGLLASLCDHLFNFCHLCPCVARTSATVHGNVIGHLPIRGHLPLSAVMTAVIFANAATTRLCSVSNICSSSTVDDMVCIEADAHAPRKRIISAINARLTDVQRI